MRTKPAAVTEIFSQVVWMRTIDRKVFYAFASRSGNTAGTLAKKVGKSRQLISAIARGERNCDPKLAHQLIAAMDLPVESLPLIFDVHEARVSLRSSVSTRQKNRAEAA